MSTQSIMLEAGRLCPIFSEGNNATALMERLGGNKVAANSIIIDSGQAVFWVCDYMKGPSDDQINNILSQLPSPYYPLAPA